MTPRQNPHRVIGVPISVRSAKTALKRAIQPPISSINKVSPEKIGSDAGIKNMPTKTEAAPTLAAALDIPPSLASIGLPGSPAPERRQSPRVVCEGTAKVVVLGGALTFTGKPQDLSVAGCRIVTEVAFTLERGTQVEVLMVVNHTAFRVAAGVRSNHKQRGVGLEFMNVSARSARLIHDLIAELEAKQEREAANQPA